MGGFEIIVFRDWKCICGLKVKCVNCENVIKWEIKMSSFRIYISNKLFLMVFLRKNYFNLFVKILKGVFKKKCWIEKSLYLCKMSRGY